MSRGELAADARVLWRLVQGQPRRGSHAQRLEAFYAPQADRYDQFRARLLHGREELIRKLDIRPGMTVVELGCGTGANLDALAATVPLDELAGVTLVDLCTPLLNVARGRTAGLERVSVVEADVTHWRPSRPVDRVFLSYSLTMMPDWEAVLDNARAMLAPEGRLGVVDFHLPQASSRLGKGFWRRWFAHDGVYLSEKHLESLKACHDEWYSEERRAPVPYLPGLRAPYYLFVGKKR
ncbi:MAG: class I SAM-dependent methyltransferase [Pseudomonadota bacterium]